MTLLLTFWWSIWKEVRQGSVRVPSRQIRGCPVVWNETILQFLSIRRSPDLNPIEHVWDALGRRIGARHPSPRTLVELRTALLEEWGLLPLDLLQSLCGNPITHPQPRLPSTFHLGITTEPVKVDRITEDGNMQRMTEAEDEYVADALTNMQPHCEDRVGRLTDAIRGQAVPHAEEAIIYPFHRSHATGSLRQYSHLQRSTPASISHFKMWKTYFAPNLFLTELSTLQSTPDSTPLQTYPILRHLSLWFKFSVSSAITEVVEKLNGQNYRSWKYNIKMLLIEKGLWDVMFKDEDTQDAN
ncbi:hypothetical protein LAZ67_1003991 [Cordylochernes scorpioides]|uniref:Transposase n=1 Tax=Cordylochernes scorpioides TaxID=51811 RepID=A0ABY6JXE0_9ARAC|nr:hypothetical protein LAZ67_1003991 [Cordylochernes scorpioides]